MDNRKSSGVIKLFFEIDDSKAALSMDQILNTNDDMAKQLSAQNLELQESRIKIQQLSEANKNLERTKKADDMALAAYKALKQESMKDITRLQAEVKNLKLDLLAERELRRFHQGKLREFDPQNDDYNPDSIETVNKPMTSSLEGAGPSMTASDLSVEAKPSVAAPKPAAANSFDDIPSKLVKSSAKSNLLDKIKFPESRWSLGKKENQTAKPAAPSSNTGDQKRSYGTLVSSTSSTSAPAFEFPAPSTPSFTFNTKPVSFGDGPAFPAPLPPSSSKASTSNNLFKTDLNHSFIRPSPLSQDATSQSRASIPSSSGATTSNPFVRLYRDPSVPPFSISMPIDAGTSKSLGYSFTAKPSER